MRILVVAAHLDDEILGVGGALLKHKSQGDETFVCIATRGYPPEWSEGQIKKELAEAKRVDEILGISKRFYCDFPVVKLNTLPHGEFNRKISEIVNLIQPDIIYTHFENDINKDHGVVFNGVMVAARPIDKRIKLFCFETMSSTEWNYKSFIPNMYVNIENQIDKKVDVLPGLKARLWGDSFAYAQELGFPLRVALA